MLRPRKIARKPLSRSERCRLPSGGRLAQPLNSIVCRISPAPRREAQLIDSPRHRPRNGSKPRARRLDRRRLRTQRFSSSTTASRRRYIGQKSHVDVCDRPQQMTRGPPRDRDTSEPFFINSGRPPWNAAVVAAEKLLGIAFWQSATSKICDNSRLAICGFRAGDASRAQRISAPLLFLFTIRRRASPAASRRSSGRDRAYLGPY